MKPRPLWAAVCVLLFWAVSAGAQSQRPAADDPLTGNWGHNGVTFLELKFDGDKAVSGTAIWRHDDQEQRTEIKTGTFDAKTGALKLEGEMKPPGHDDALPYVIEGKLENDALSGTFKVGTDGGQFTFTKIRAEK